MASFNRFWAWLNGQSIAPWILAIAGGFWLVAILRTEVSAHGEEIKEQKSATELRITVLKDDFRRDHDQLRNDILDRLDDIKVNQQLQRDSLDVVRDNVREIKSDVEVLKRRK